MISAAHSLGSLLLLSAPKRPSGWLVRPMSTLAPQPQDARRRSRYFHRRPNKAVTRQQHRILPQQDPTTCRSLDTLSLLTLSAMKNHDARVELLKRNIQSVDQVSYQVASETFRTMAAYQQRFTVWQTIPHKLGISIALTAGFGSIPLCFHLPTVHWFNHHHVTTDIPEPADLETWLEVGAWAWNWMEPPLGQISFLLLCLQFSRSQLDNLGIRPYTRWRKHRLAQQLAATFPRYNSKLVMDYSKTTGFYNNNDDGDYQ